MSKILLISDYLYPECKGGAEINDHVALQILRPKFNCSIKSCEEFNLSFYHDCDFSLFLVSNYVKLSEDAKLFLKYKKYVIIEHDYKFCPSRNPAKYPNFKSPEILNFDFYSNAHAIVCQSMLQKEIFNKNLGLSNLISFGGNLWTDDQFEVIEKAKENQKENKYAILEPDADKIKGREEAVSFCVKNGLQFKLIPSLSYQEFIYELSTCRGFVFFPSSPETFSRVTAEAKMLGLEIIHNENIGVCGEDYFKDDSSLFLDKMKKKRLEFVDLISTLNSQSRFFCKYVSSKNIDNMFYL